MNGAMKAGYKINIKVLIVIGVLSAIFMYVAVFHKSVIRSLTKCDIRKPKSYFNMTELNHWKVNTTIELGNLVQRRIHYLQNPKDCRSAKIILCDLTKEAGFGSLLHHVAYCLITAYNTHRTLILESEDFMYAKTGWETFFLPLSETCTTRFGESAYDWDDICVLEDERVVSLPLLGYMKNRPPWLLDIPEDIATLLKALHGQPFVWWVGQIVKYLTRPVPHLEEDIKRFTTSAAFKHPIVGMHVRRTDKITEKEADFHCIYEYMKYAEDYYNSLPASKLNATEKRRVYLATDEPKLLNLTREKYTGYTILSNNEASEVAENLKTRYSVSSLRSIILEIFILSKTDYLVCTFSSNVGRAIYEIMQTMYPEATQRALTIDKPYVF